MTGNRLVFAGGAPRSGLTLLRALVNAHPHIFCGPDIGVLPGLPLQWRDFSQNLGDLHEGHFSIGRQAVRENFAHAISSVLDKAPAAAGKKLIVEKTSLNVLIFEDLAALFPKAKLIHVVRDGRDVAASLLQRNWTNPRTGAPLDHVRDAGAAARHWAGLTGYGLNAQRAINDPARFHLLRYEDLVARPKRTLRALFEFLEIGFDKSVFDFHTQDLSLLGTENDSVKILRSPLTDKRVGRWRNLLTPSQHQIVETAAAPMLKAFGYG